MFSVGEKLFPVVVDYQVDVRQAEREARKHVVWSGNIDFENRTFPYAELGREEFVCRYATLLEDCRFREIKEALPVCNLRPADMMQLFAFITRHVKAEVTAQNPFPIVAAAPGSVWLCSYGILPEMAGVNWSSFHHAPGPDLGTVFEGPHRGFEKGTRFLTFEIN